MSVTEMVFVLLLAVVLALTLMAYVGQLHDQEDKQRAHDLELARLAHDEEMARCAQRST